MKYILLQITLFSGEVITSFESMTDNQFENFEKLGKETIENFRKKSVVTILETIEK